MRNLSLDFVPGHDSEKKDAPVQWCASYLGITTTPEDWTYEGWGIYTCNRAILTDEQWQDMRTNWDKYEGRCRGAASNKVEEVEEVSDLDEEEESVNDIEIEEEEEYTGDCHAPVYQVMAMLPNGEAYTIGFTTTPKLFTARYVSERMQRGTECIFHPYCSATYTRHDGEVIQIAWILWSQDREIWIKVGDI